MPRDASGRASAAARQMIRAVAGWQAGLAGVLVVAIDGHGAAGKSTISGAVADATGAALVHTDDFFQPGPEPGGPERLWLEGPPGSSRRDTRDLSRYYDWRRVRAEALEPLRAGRAAEFRRFDWERGSVLDGTVSVTPSSLIVLEGVFSAAPELSELVDWSVFVDTPSRERLRRLRAQVTPEEWDDDWLIAEQGYFDVIRPPSSFDLVVRGACSAAGG